MHQLPCPHCQAPIPVSPAQAGDQLTCPSCAGAVQVPKLGELRQLPLESAVPEPSPPPEAGSLGGRAAWVSLGIVATVSLLIAGFCGIRWALIDVPLNTEQHIAELRQQYETLPAAQLIREWEQMERYGIDLASPYSYQKVAAEKRAWGVNAAVAGVIGLLCMLIAAAIARAGRRHAAPPPRTR